jgi:hypothetical protein
MFRGFDDFAPDIFRQLKVLTMIVGVILASFFSVNGHACDQIMLHHNQLSVLRTFIIFADVQGAKVIKLFSFFLCALTFCC